MNAPETSRKPQAGMSPTTPFSSHPFTTVLLKWYRTNGRDLPWRNTCNPYAIWLSEVILQQTQVKQGWDYWLRFMRRWPTVECLAAATEDEVLREWQGLGYYSRARHLHVAAKQIVERGGFPITAEKSMAGAHTPTTEPQHLPIYQWFRSLKGVGDYTAAAIASLAYEEPVAVVDGNVYRVLSRYFGIATPINTTKGKKEFALLAQSLLPSPLTSHPSTYNQAIMDFGAIQCTPSTPHCTDCPLSDSCVAFRNGSVSLLPAKIKTLKVRERHLTYVYLRYQGQTAIHRRGEGDIWQGLYEPLLMEEGELMPKVFSEHPPLHYQLIRQDVKHVLTHRILLADFYLCEADERPSLPEGYFWIEETRLDDYAKPRLIEHLLEML
jgi:A/G-specific adenine glycosylase